MLSFTAIQPKPSLRFALTFALALFFLWLNPSTAYGQTPESTYVVGGGTLTFNQTINHVGCRRPAVDVTYDTFVYTQDGVNFLSFPGYTVTAYHDPILCSEGGAYLTLPTPGLLIYFQAHGVIFQPPTIGLNNPVTGSPSSCAADATGTGGTAIFTCLTNANGDLVAVAQNETPSGGAIYDPTLNYLDLALNNPSFTPINGTIGSSSCASTADSSGDIVCAYADVSNSNYATGIRFNVTTVYVSASLSLLIASSTTNNPSCAIGAPRASGNATGTVCAIVDSSYGVLGYSFDPAVGSASIQSVNLNISTITGADPSCVNPYELNSLGTSPTYTPITCGVNTGVDLSVVTFDPRQPMWTPISPSTVAGGTFSYGPACAAPYDGTDNITCAILDTSSNLNGYRFSLTPASSSTNPGGYNAAVGSTLSLGSITTTPPSCTGFGPTPAATASVFCGYLDASSNVSGIEFDPGVMSGSIVGPSSSSTATQSAPACNYQEETANDLAVSCAGLDTTMTIPSVFIPATPPSTF